MQQPNQVELQDTIPRPQTVSGFMNTMGQMAVIDDTEMPGEQYNPMLWAARQYYISRFEFSSSDTSGTKLYETRANAISPNTRSPVELLLGLTRRSRYKVKLTFWAIKPQAMPGRLLIRWRPNWEPQPYKGPASEPVYVFDSKKREISKEWDLAATDVCEFDVEAPNIVNWRTHHCRRGAPGVSLVGLVSDLGGRNRSDAMHGYGNIRVEVLNTLQPGGIFPDSIDILVFGQLIDAEFGTVVGFPYLQSDLAQFYT